MTRWSLVCLSYVQDEAERRALGLPVGNDFVPLSSEPAIQRVIFGQALLQDAQDAAGDGGMGCTPTRSSSFRRAVR